MGIVLNREAAVTGFLNAVAVETTRLSVQDGQAYALEEIRFRPLDIIHYANILRHADCGPIIKDFDEESLIALMESRDDLFEVAGDNVFTLRSSVSTSNALLGILVHELRPRFNYPAKLLRFMMLFN